MVGQHRAHTLAVASICVDWNGGRAAAAAGALESRCAYNTVPAALAIRGHRSAHSLATGPEMADPFMSPLTLTITPALSSK